MASVRSVAGISVPTTGPAKVAVTERAALIVTVQLGTVPEQAPPHDCRLWPLAASAVSVTTVPGSKSSPQSVPQRIPPGADVTIPNPTVETDSRYRSGDDSNRAVTPLC